MRLLIDLQGAQTESRRRGIGRYSISLARAIIRNAGEHEVWIGLTSALPRTVAYAREVIGDLLPDDRFLIWDSVGPTGDVAWANDGPLGQAQVVREAAIAALAPDVVLCSSIIEGAGESAVSTTNRHFAGPRTAVMLYDLIPLLDERYLQGTLERWYRRRLAELRRADLLLAISESSAREGRELLGLAADRLVDIRAAADDAFVPMDITPEQEKELRERYSITKPFVMYSGGIDPRKNLHGLIAAFAQLPEATRDAHELVIVGSGDKMAFPALFAHIKRVGLRENQVVFTGFVREEDMAPLYNISKAFVFPSKHEGFGLPPLEAMSCGIPTIAADNSSLPEVLGNAEAMFDAEDVPAISAKMLRVLTDDDFRESLRTKGLEQARTFSWDTTAHLAIAALERLAALPAEAGAPAPQAQHRPRLALVTALGEPRTSLRRRVLHLVDQLDAFYDVHIVSTSQEKPWAFEGPARLVTIEDFDEIAGTFDRILHHYANSPEYGFVRDIQSRHPGTVLLDDYYLDRALPTTTEDLSAEASWVQSVIEDHGYDVLHQQIEDRRQGVPVARLPLNGRVLDYANGVLVTDPRIIELGARDRGPDAVADWATVPLLAPGALTHHASDAQKTLVLMGTGGSANLLHRLVPAWLASDLASEESNQLVIVGVRLDEPYGRLLADLLAQGSPAARYRFEAGTDSALTSDVRLAVQLSLGPDAAASRASLDCQARGIMVLTNDDELLAREFSQSELTRAIEQAWHGDAAARTADPVPQRADAYRDAIERFHAHGPLAFQCNVLHTAARQPELDPDKWPQTVSAVMRNHPIPGPRQLLLDVSSLVRIDYRTGIQRVARSLARVMMITPPEGFRVEPVFCDKAGVLRYARTYATGLLGYNLRLRNEPVVARRGDVFAGLDLNDRAVPSQLPKGPRHPIPLEGALEQLRSRGVSCHFIVYDLLPIRHPEWFPSEMDWFDPYIRALVTRGDGIICDSKAIADDVQDWIRENVPSRIDMPVRWFHLGADLENSAPTAHLTPDFEKRWARRGPGPSILIVGTLEPRKGHDQVIAAFSDLWRRGVDANLVIVGRAGWGMAELQGRLSRHPEWGKRLLWFSTASDTELLRLYQASDGFIMASRGEGFGLPIIEAARHDIPIMARDLPVFREISGDNVRYFSGDAPEDLAARLEPWFAELVAGTAPHSNGIKYTTWEESTAQYLAALRKNLADLGQPTGL